MKRRKEAGLPEHLREWPETNLEDLERFYRERLAWAEEHGNESTLWLMREYFHRSHEMKFGEAAVKPRTVPDPDKAAADRVAIEKLLTRARDHGPDGWWKEAIEGIEAALQADPPDLAAAKRAWRNGLHITDDQASAAVAGYQQRRP